MEALDLFSKKIRIDKNELKQALTHSGFYENNDEHKSNSRFVFEGMFVFKGQVAEILLKYFSGSGTQLQHVLGNLFRNENLNKLFDEWKLINLIRVSEKFDVKIHKHIFVYAIFGCISRLDVDNRRRAVFQYLINDSNHAIFNHIQRNKDFVGQANELAKKTMGKKLKIQLSLTPEMLHKAVVSLGTGTILAEATSKSYHYARKKAMKQSLEILSRIAFEKYANETSYIERMQKRIEGEKEQKRQELQQKLEEKAKRRLQKIEVSKRKKVERDLARKKLQSELRTRKAVRQKLLAEKKAKEQLPMSAKKRRHLQDKKK